MDKVLGKLRGKLGYTKTETVTKTGKLKMLVINVSEVNHRMGFTLTETLFHYNRCNVNNNK